MTPIRRIARAAALALIPGLRARLDADRAEIDRLRAAVQAAEPPLPAQTAQAAEAALLRATLDAWLPTHLLQGPRVTHRGLRMAVHRATDLYISACIRDYGIWEPVETDCLLDGLEAGDHFIDIGANIGYYALLAADLVGPTGRVFAFEPEPANCGLLRLNLALNGMLQAEVIEAAVSDGAGQARLHLSPDNLGDRWRRASPAPGPALSVSPRYRR